MYYTEFYEFNNFELSAIQQKNRILKIVLCEQAL